jgi:hypothetical protein
MATAIQTGKQLAEGVLFHNALQEALHKCGIFSGSMGLLGFISQAAG